MLVVTDTSKVQEERRNEMHATAAPESNQPRWAASAVVRRLWLVAIVAVAATAVVSTGNPSTALAAVSGREASLETGNFGEFDQFHETNGSLRVDSTKFYDGSRSARASFAGGGANGFGRGVWNVSWSEGEEVWYSGAFFLPAGFKAAMQNEVALMRWDNWGTYQGGGDVGGIVIWNSDKRARLKLGSYSAADEQVLVGPFDIPEERWFHVEVHQKFSAVPGVAVNSVYIDGARVGGSSRANSAGRPIDRVRYGIVAVGGSNQTNPLTLWFDRARVTTSKVGPLNSSAAGTGVNVPGGYRMIAGNGASLGFGSTGATQETAALPLGPGQVIVGAAQHPAGGTWLVTQLGGVHGVGGVPFHGSLDRLRLNHPIVGIAASPTGNGYWLVASDGGVFAFGDATFHGSTGAIRLNRPIVGIAASPTGKGYRLVASDGGVFAFGDATFHGSTGAIRLNRPIVGIASSPTGTGYRMVATDGGVFAFGDATFHGSTGAIVLNRPIAGIAATASGNGYWMVATDGGVFAFGDAPFQGSAANKGSSFVALVS